MKTKTHPRYYVDESPDTGQQFLVEEGVDGNIAELTPKTVRILMTAPELLEAVKLAAVLRPGNATFLAALAKAEGE